MNQLWQQLGGPQSGGQQEGSGDNQPRQINVNIVVTLQQSYINMQIRIDPGIPFNIFIQGISEQIFARMQSQYEDNIQYELGSGGQIKQNETRSLANLGFVANCTLYVRLMSRQYGQKIELKIKVKIPQNLQLQEKQSIKEYFFTTISLTPICFVLARILEVLSGILNKDILKQLKFYYISDSESEVEIQDFMSLLPIRPCCFKIELIIITMPLTIQIVMLIKHQIYKYSLQAKYSDSFIQLFKQIQEQCQSYLSDFEKINKFYILLDNKIEIDAQETKDLVDLGFNDNSILQFQCFLNEQIN